MKLSDLVRAANGADPEVLIVEDSGDGWAALPLEERSPFPCMKDGYLVIAADPNARPVMEDSKDFKP